MLRFTISDRSSLKRTQPANSDSLLSDAPGKPALFKVETLNIVAHNEHDHLVGGLSAQIFFGWMYIDTIWGQTSYPILDIELIRLAEQEAQKRTCLGIYFWSDHHNQLRTYHSMGYERLKETKGVFRELPRTGFMKHIAA